MDAHYLGYFECFNRQLFFEAHEVLEELWLADRHGANGNFYKGLIQLAGAFVHIQKERPGPATALFKLAQANLQQYPAEHEQLDVGGVLALAAEWTRLIHQANPPFRGLTAENAPRLAVREPRPSPQPSRRGEGAP